MNIQLKWLTAGLLVAGIFFGAALPAPAALAPTRKEEVVYGIYSASGTLQHTYVVNSFSPAAGETVLDYGQYSQVRAMTSTAPIQQTGDRIEIQAENSERLFYEGQLENPALPWNFSIRYWLDGVLLSPDELPGKSGSFQLEMQVSPNETAPQGFFDAYALQTTFTLDGACFSNIQAEGATLANIGSNRQLTFTTLPGTEKTMLITADVENFRMDPISIAGVRLAMDLNFNTQEFSSQFTELSQGAADLDKGAKQLSGGIQELKSGVSALATGIAQLQSGANELNNQSGNLVGGSAQIKQALHELQTGLQAVSISSSDLAELVAASEAISTGIASLNTAAGQLSQAATSSSFRQAMGQSGADVAGVLQGNAEAAAGLQAQITQLEQMRDAAQDPGQQAQYQALINSLQPVTGLLQANNAVISGAEQYINGLGTKATGLASGISSLQTSYGQLHAAILQMQAKLAGMAEGMAKMQAALAALEASYGNFHNGLVNYTNAVASIQSGVASLNSATASLQNGVAQLSRGAENLHAGTSRLRETTSGIDQKITEKLEDKINSMTGSEIPVRSFVSDKNTNVKSVQFVFRTSAIELPSQEPAASSDDAPQKSSFWERLRKLFE